MMNYFNTLSLREKLEQLGKCRFMEAAEFSDGVKALKGKKSGSGGGGALGLKLHSVASLGPGYDHSAVPGRKPLIIPRDNGEFYRGNWERLLSLSPEHRPSMVAVET